MVRDPDGGRRREEETREGPHSGGRNITKVSAASQFAKSKRALVSEPETGKKGQLGVQEQIKIACTSSVPSLLLSPGVHPLPSSIPCTRLFVGGEDEKIERKSEPRALFIRREGPQKSPRQDNRTITSFRALIRSRARLCIK